MLIWLFNKSPQGTGGQASNAYVAPLVWCSDIIHHSASWKIPPHALSLSDQDTQYGKPERNQLAELLITVLDDFFFSPGLHSIKVEVSSPGGDFQCRSVKSGEV